MGDQVLKIVADLFRNVIREGDLLCRQGGDELVVLVPEAGQEQSCAAESCLPSCSRWLRPAPGA
ncbi:diguanylate cyclase [Cyanobium sp. Alchichica 3B3-8F6]|nr:diguanylate cyclase [Cyanobium sp. Alchichica 3B3-8F6]MCP9943122.1 diguanylate cyclase [Cyanobium sp. ATX 6E8]